MADEMEAAGGRWGVVYDQGDFVMRRCVILLRDCKTLSKRTPSQRVQGPDFLSFTWNLKLYTLTAEPLPKASKSTTNF